MTTILLYFIQAIFTGYFRSFKRVNRSEHERSPNEFIGFLEYKGENCFIPSRYACFLKCNIYIFKRGFGVEYLEFIQSYKRRTNVMTPCRIPEGCQR